MAYSAWPLVGEAEVDAGGLGMPARQCAQVLSQWQNGTITKSPGAKERDLGADLLDDADHLVADRWRPAVIGFSPR